VSADPVLAVSGLRVVVGRGEPIVDDVSLAVRPGEILGLVGESGSGKTTTALALLGYARSGVRITAGEVTVAGQRLALGDERAARRLRGRLVSYVPQDPSTSLDPSRRIGQAIRDMLDRRTGPAPGADPVGTALAAVHLPATPAFARRYPHELSGGQQQRVAIAAALACEPPLVVLDEPTTGLDVVTQARVLDEIARLRIERALAMVYVTHDLAVVGQIADRICVMYAGRIVEEGPTRAMLRRPRHPYTRGLVASIPDHAEPRRVQAMPGVAVGVGERPPGCAFAPRCPQRTARGEQELPELEDVADGWRVRCFEWQQTPPLVIAERVLEREPTQAAQPLLAVESLRAGHGRGADAVVAADDVSFALAPGGCLALVGESGSGKTTIARCVVGLHAPWSGRVLLDGRALAAQAADRDKESRRRVQIVFQNPYDSLNPRHRVGDAIGRPARQLRDLSAPAARAEVSDLLERVRLPPRVAERFPAELSGGERQRVAIARALAAHPDVLVCDEITSALDVSVQAAVLELLATVRDELGLALLFITHDLGVVATVADSVVVLELGQVREQGTVRQVLTAPEVDYTRRLVAAAPRLPEADEAELAT
jgi:peptide/nickel transport system ATP-binding protein